MKRPDFEVMSDLVEEAENYCSLLEEGHSKALKDKSKYKKDREDIVNLTLSLKEQVKSKDVEIAELNEEVDRIKNEVVALDKTITGLKKEASKEEKDG